MLLCRSDYQFNLSVSHYDLVRHLCARVQYRRKSLQHAVGVCFRDMMVRHCAQALAADGVEWHAVTAQTRREMGRGNILPTQTENDNISLRRLGVDGDAIQLTVG